MIFYYELTAFYGSRDMPNLLNKYITDRYKDNDFSNMSKKHTIMYDFLSRDSI